MTHTTRPARRLAGILLLAVLPLTTACSSATTGPGSAATSAPSSVAASTTTTATAAGAEYCDALREGTEALNKISGSISDPAAAAEGVAVLKKIEASAPTEVKEAWTDLITFVEAVAAGDTTAVATAAEKMTSSMASIEEHARTECGITLS